MPRVMSTAALEDIKGKATIPVYPDAANLLGISRSSAYQAAADGSLPTLRFGSRLVVPVRKLLAMLGDEPESGATTPAAQGQSA